MELTFGSETSAFKTQTPGNNPEDYTLYSQHGDSLKSTTNQAVWCLFVLTYSQHSMTLSVAIGHSVELYNNSRIINWKWCGLSDCSLIEICFFHGATATRGLIIVLAPQSRSDTPQSVRIVWTSDQPGAETATWQHTTLTRDRHPCPRARFEPAIPIIELLQTHALDCPATGISNRDDIQTFTCR
jgi:hypothetical protein